MSLGLVIAGCGGSAAESQSLRLREVVLYQNGVAYFDRDGRVEGRELRLAVRAHEIDDVLTTLTVLDRSAGDTDAPPPAPSAVVPRALEDDEEVHTLAVDLGAARRDLRVGYATQTSAWRASYRMVLPEQRGEGEALLQGWAVIDNTTAEDWRDVSVTLATAAPLSFAVDLRTPRIVERPNVTGHVAPPVAVGPVYAERARAMDSDADGIADVDDVCPADPEGYNGYDDEDGCPDRARVVVRDAALTILEHVYFESGSSRIQAASRPVLDAIGATLRANPRLVEVRVRGHADAAERHGQVLSRRRAEAVRDALEEAGVEPSRLVVEAAGASEPLDPRPTAQARERNRRVSFEAGDRGAGGRDAGDRGAGGGNAGGGAPAAPPAGRIEGLARALRGVPAPRAGASGTRYAIAGRISVEAGQSAMVAMLDARVGGEDVLLLRNDPAVPGSARHPFRAARLRNDSDVDLVPGPMALFAGGEFLGEGLIDGLLVGQNAFVPYALDEGTHVRSTVTRDRLPSRLVAIAEGRVTLEQIAIARTAFEVTPGERVPERIYLRVDRGAGWDPHEPPPGTETAPDALLVPVPMSRFRGRDPEPVVVEQRARERVVVDLVDDVHVELEPYLDGGVPQGTDVARLRALVADRQVLADLDERAELYRVRLAENAARAEELRQSLESLAETGAETARVRRRIAGQLEEATRDGERLAAELADLRARQTEARDALRQAARDFTAGPVP